MIITAQNNRYHNSYKPVSLPSFKALEKTFAMLKPDAFERHLDKMIIEEIEKNNFKIVKTWRGIAPRKKLENNYIEFKNKSFFKEWMDFLQSGDVQGMVIEGDNAIEKFRKFTFQIRDKLAPGDKRKNLLHSSDCAEAAKRELENFFDKNV